MLQVLLQLMSAQIIYSVSSFLFFNMKRPREDDADWRQQRCTKIQTGSNSTSFNPKETYECCKPCLRHFMEQHWPVIKWWKWNGEGDA